MSIDLMSNVSCAKQACAVIWDFDLGGDFRLSTKVMESVNRSGGSSNGLLCPIRTGPTSENRDEIRGYKLGKQKFSYNAITLLLQDTCGPKIIASAVEAPIGNEVVAELKQSCLKYNLHLASGDELCAYLFLVFAKNVATDEPQQYAWQVVTRENCLRGCEGPMLMGIRRYGRTTRGILEERHDRAKDPSKLYVAIDEACAHLDHKSPRFRLVLGLYSEKQEVATAVSGVIRIVANNDAPRGSASFDLVCNMHGSEAAPAINQPGEPRPPLQEIVTNVVTSANRLGSKPKLKERLGQCKEKAAIDAVQKDPPASEVEEQLDLSGDAEDPRQQRTLTSLVERLLELFGNKVGSVLSLGCLAEDLGVKKRRIYDVMNVLESIQVVERKAQDLYIWKGASSIKDALDALAFEAEMRTIDADGETPHSSNEEASATEAPRRDTRLFKSLKVLSEEFVRVFLADQGQVILLNKAVSAVLGGLNDGVQSIRRRLYDVANILSCLHLVVKFQASQGPAYLWLGIPGLQERLGEFPGVSTTTRTVQYRKRKSDDSLSTPRQSSQPTASPNEPPPKRRSLPRGSRPVRLPSDDFADAFLTRSGFKICEEDSREKPSHSGRPPLSPVPLPPRQRPSAPASAFRRPVPLAQSSSSQNLSSGSGKPPRMSGPPSECAKPPRLSLPPSGSAKPPRLSLPPGASHQPGQPLASPTLTYNPFEPFLPARLQPTFTLPSRKPPVPVLRPTPRRLSSIPPVPRFPGPAPPGNKSRREPETVRRTGARLSIPGHRRELSEATRVSTSDFTPYRQPACRDLPGSCSGVPLSTASAAQVASRSSLARPEYDSGRVSAPVAGESKRSSLPSEPTVVAGTSASVSPRPGSVSEGHCGDDHIPCQTARADLATSSEREAAPEPGSQEQGGLATWTDACRDVRINRPFELLNNVTQVLLLLRNPAALSDADEYTRALADARTRILPHIPAADLRRQLPPHLASVMGFAYQNGRAKANL
ncbi:Transcription factor E2F/dimerization partner (TDP)-like protein with Winged helix-turn-helix transcription repressor DNA-binding [Klebsormidium nitens]|uniref:Transcription factor E2F/dimerization partner (TDP)-like protein with Winged helix-turn-helix transcription repressor DNA-binding n=1 Tax=Klebsormidium nitens TaxID=105231 RepID=A0A1Y1HXQ4_KLENI|nr:Transcription factor E2F/dimerization partner (TDP)-like protein with Winged helix-turn-helix transcription repressor DNA-binding [Klebsormidium nitens]|eukprot:GAQ81731.1 Transcription factor E2F/dimerization partner (TDP)-like protein with Winged helix-turn-helix transcription repressor DNA-binding [Klebsormidium nitens]